MCSDRRIAEFSFVFTWMLTELASGRRSAVSDAYWSSQFMKRSAAMDPVFA